MLEGYKAWIGIVLTVVGTFGVYEKLGISSEQATEIIETAFQFIGLLLTAYGNYDVHKRLKEAKQ
jgi:hypothetical protein